MRLLLLQYLLQVVLVYKLPEAYKLKQPVIDTTGAGDAFNGAFAVGLANDLDIKEALSFANKVAGISTTRLGAASSMPFAKELTDN